MLETQMESKQHGVVVENKKIEKVLTYTKYYVKLKK